PPRRCCASSSGSSPARSPAASSTTSDRGGGPRSRSELGVVALEERHHGVGLLVLRGGLHVDDELGHRWPERAPHGELVLGRGRAGRRRAAAGGPSPPLPERGARLTPPATRRR